MKKVNIRFLSAVLVILMLCAFAGCKPSTNNTEEPTSPPRPTTVESTGNPTEDPTEGNTVDALFEADFADLSGWSDVPAAGIPEDATVGIVDGQLSVEVPTSVSSVVGKAHKLENLSGRIAIELDVSVTFPAGAPSNKGGAAIVVSTEGGAAIAVYFFNGGIGYYNVDRTPSAGVTQIADAVYTSGTACHLKMVADTDTDTYDIYFDGELLVGGVKFRNNGDAFNKIQLSSGATDVGATAVFDNLVIAQTEEPMEEPENNPTEDPAGDPTEGNTGDVLYEDDFADLKGWADMPAAGIPAGATVGIVDGKLSVAVPTSISSVVGKTHKLENFSGKVAFEVDVTVNFPNGSPSNKGGAAVIVNTEGGASLAIYIFNGKLGYYNIDRTDANGTAKPGVTQIADAVYTSGTTCRLKLVADTDADTYDVYINGELLVGGVKFRNNGDKFNKIQLSSGATDVGATAVFDNLKIYNMD